MRTGIPICCHIGVLKLAVIGDQIFHATCTRLTVSNNSKDSGHISKIKLGAMVTDTIVINVGDGMLAQTIWSGEPTPRHPLSED